MYRKPKIKIVGSDYVTLTPLAVTSETSLQINGDLFVNGTNIQSAIDNLANITIDREAEDLVQDLYSLGFHRHEIVNAIAGVIRMQRGW